MEYDTLFIYALTNAYDVYSAAALSHLKHIGIIHRVELFEHGGYIFSKGQDAVAECLIRHNMTYKMVDLSWLSIEN